MLLSYYVVGPECMIDPNRDLHRWGDAWRLPGDPWHRPYERNLVGCQLRWMVPGELPVLQTAALTEPC